MIEDTQLAVQIIKHPTKDRVRFDIFDRVNRGGTPLNKQEMRNALYQGNSTKLLNRLSHMLSFKKATGNSISPIHMKDKYIILRALCFYLLYQVASATASPKYVVLLLFSKKSVFLKINRAANSSITLSFCKISIVFWTMKVSSLSFGSIFLSH